jgi:hypothetical protein
MARRTARWRHDRVPVPAHRLLTAPLNTLVGVFTGDDEPSGSAPAGNYNDSGEFTVIVSGL